VTAWQGKTRGGIAGYKIFIGVLKFFGLSFAYLLLRFVALYFLFFSPKSFKNIYRFYRIRRGYGIFRSFIFVYRNYYAFGQVLLDKIATLAGFNAKFTFDFEGEEHLRKMVEEKTGGILISAHIGNFEMAGHLLERLQTRINIIMFDAEHARIKDYLASITNKSYHVIVLKNDNSHIYEINKVLNNKEIICIHGDRFIPGSKVMVSEFLGEKACFPSGPFYLAMKYNVPVSFVFAMREKHRHYHFYATPLFHYQQQTLPVKRDQTITTIIKNFICELEKTIGKYPDQWFNYYNFWEKNE
jgi:predicted LPLAT superfamily acyltransferase